MKILFIGFLCPDERIRELTSHGYDPGMAAVKTQRALVQGIEEALGTTVNLMGCEPLPEFPRYRRIFVPRRKWSHAGDSADVTIPFVNVILAKHLSRFAATLFEIALWLHRHKGENRVVLIYSMHSPYLAAVLALSKLARFRKVLFVPDLPMYTDVGIRRGLLRRPAKSVDIRLLLRAIRKMDGLIAVTRHIGADYAPELPCLIVEGVFQPPTLEDEDEAGEARRENSGEKAIMYAGRVSREYGVHLLLQAFSLLKEPFYRLWIAGEGPYQAEVKAAAQKDPRITSLGFLPNEKILRLQKQAAALVNPRPSNQVFVNYSFPSKILEYLSSGTPLITTKLGGIPSEYRDHVFFLEEETPRELARLLERVCSLTREEASRLGEINIEYVRTQKSPRKQGERIVEFLRRLTRPHGKSEGV